MSLFQAFLNTARLFAGSAEPTPYLKKAPAKAEPEKTIFQLVKEQLAQRRAEKAAARQAEADVTVFQEDDFQPTQIQLRR